MLHAEDGTSFFKETGSSKLNIDGTEFTVSVGMHVSELQAADWIYASAIDSSGSGAFLAGYSGRVIEVDIIGNAVRAYDIGAVPKRIVDTGDFLYILTDTLLYVLQAGLMCRLFGGWDGVDSGNFGQYRPKLRK